MLEFTSSRPAFIILVLILATQFSCSRAIRGEFFSLISDGIDQKGHFKILQSGKLSESVTCEPKYGFLPCANNVWGHLFLMVVYQYLLALAEMYISNGSNLFFEMFGTGIFGAGLFPILGIFPQLVLVLVTGLSASEDTVGSVAAMGMGVLAGTTILNLTIVWSSVVAFGSYSLLEGSSSSDWESEEPFSFTSYGVRTDKETKDTAKIMMLSIIPFVLLLLSGLLHSPSAEGIIVLICLIITVFFLFSYCTYQVFQPWIQKRRLEYLMRQHFRKKLLPVLCNRSGRPSVAKISRLFNRLDRNKNAKISADELRSLIVGVQIDELGLSEDDGVSHVMEEFDISGDSSLSRDEFIKGLSNWLSKANDNTISNQVENKSKVNGNNSKVTTEERQSLMADKNQSKKDARKSAWWNYIKASFLVFLGVAMTVLLSPPLLQTVQAFATTVNIPSFLVSYFLIPLALSFRKAYRAIISASEKTENSVSLTLSEIYGSVFMNNITGLVSFLTLIYVRNVAWNVSAEILVVPIICIGIGLSASFSSRFPFWTCIVTYALYPLSLALVYVLIAFWNWG